METYVERVEQFFLVQTVERSFDIGQTSYEGLPGDHNNTPITLRS